MKRFCGGIMKLSIQNIVDWFVEHQYLIHSEIREPEPCLLNVNWLSDQKLRPETVYVEQYSAAADTQLNTTIVTLHNDIIRVDGCEPGEAFNILLSIFEWFNNWERRLLFCILAQQSIQQMCDIGDEVFQAPTIICGNDGQTFAITTHYSAKISPVWRARLEDDSLSFDLIQKEGGKKYLSSLQRQSYPSLNDSPIWGGPTLNANLFYRAKGKGLSWLINIGRVSARVTCI